MSETRTCPYCRKPHATEEDWDRYKGGEGEHLCWDEYECFADADVEALANERNAALDRLALVEPVVKAACKATDVPFQGPDGSITNEWLEADADLRMACGLLEFDEEADHE